MQKLLVPVKRSSPYGTTRPTGFYADLKKKPKSRPEAEDRLDDTALIPQGMALHYTLALKKKNLMPDRHWYAKPQAYAPQPKNPTITPAPAAKGKSAPAAGKKGLFATLFAALSPEPKPTRPTIYLTTRPRKKTLENDD